MTAELDSDTQTDHQINQTDGIKTDAPVSHDSHDVDDGQQAGEGNDTACPPRAEENRGDDCNGDDTEGDELYSDRLDVFVLIKEDVEERVWEYLDSGTLCDVGRYPPSGRQGIDEIVLRFERGMESSEMAGDDGGVVVSKGHC